MNGNGSQKVRLLTAMREKATQRPHKGWVGMTVRDLSQELGITTHDITHALHDLRKQGLIDFRLSTSHRLREGHGSAADIPSRIRVTGALDEEVWQKFVGATETQAALEFADDPEVEVKDTVDDASAMLADEMMAEAVAATEEMVDLTPALLLHEDVPDLLIGLPALDALRRRGAAMSEAARLLDLVGQQDLAGLVRESREEMTRTEREMLDLFSRLTDLGLMGDLGAQRPTDG